MGWRTRRWPRIRIAGLPVRKAAQTRRRRISSKKKHFLGPQKLRCAGPKTQTCIQMRNRTDIISVTLKSGPGHSCYTVIIWHWPRQRVVLQTTRDVSNHKPFVLFCYKIQNLKFQKKKNLKFKKKKKKKKKKKS